MIRASVAISRPRREIWDWLLEPAHWKLWGQGDLLEVTPGWQAGASMTWALGLPSKLAAYQNEAVIGIESEFLLSTVGLIAAGPDETEVEIVEAPLRGASFSDGGAGRTAQLRKNLGELKRLLESRPAFLGPLAPEERLAAGHLPLDVYESVISEKTAGVPRPVSASPGPDASARLRDGQDILRKLEIGDIRRLKESVAQVMEADLVARGAKPVGELIVARGGSAGDLVRGAELYALAARWNPYNALALMSCGVALAKAGYLREALPWLERALEVDPGSERIKTNIEAVRADVAKSMRARTVPTDRPGRLPAGLAAGAIPPFDLVWPPAERPAPEAPSGRPAPASPPQAAPSPAAVTYALPVTRLAAALIDGLIVSFLTMPIQVAGMLGGPGPSGRAPRPGSVLAVLAVWWVYFAVLESTARGATFGKRLLGLRVVDLEGRRVGFGRATARFFGKLLGVLTLGVGYALAIFTPKNQALHDYLAKTLVIKDPGR